MTTHTRLRNTVSETAGIGFVLLPFLWTLACGDVVADPDAAPIDAPPKTGTFSLAWNIVDGVNDLSCDDVGALSVSVRLVQTGGFIGQAEAFSCEGGLATSRGIKPGNYQFTIDLRASGSQSLLQETIVIPNIEIVAEETIALVMQSFEVSAIGNFSFTIDSGAGAGNCESVANSGAGIVGVEFALRDDMGACVPAEFVAMAGSEAGATFTTDCVTPRAPMPCIGSDQLVSVSAASGSHQLIVNGQKMGPVDCYSKGVNFVLPGAGLQSSLGSLALDLEFSQECDPNFVVPDAGVPMVDAGVADASL